MVMSNYRVYVLNSQMCLLVRNMFNGHVGTKISLSRSIYQPHTLRDKKKIPFSSFGADT